MQARPQGRLGTEPALDLQSKNLRRERGAARARQRRAASGERGKTGGLAAAQERQGSSQADSRVTAL